MNTNIFTAHANVPAYPAQASIIAAAQLNEDTTSVPMSSTYAINCASTIMDMERSPIATQSLGNQFRNVAA